jgi:hypothetical protein
VLYRALLVLEIIHLVCIPEIILVRIIWVRLLGLELFLDHHIVDLLNVMRVEASLERV